MLEYYSIMDQYRPCGIITGDTGHPFRDSLMRGITDEEFRTAIDSARKNGLHRGF